LQLEAYGWIHKAKKRRQYNMALDRSYKHGSAYRSDWSLHWTSKVGSYYIDPEGNWEVAEYEKAD
jgi:hypothetical protein